MNKVLGVVPVKTESRRFPMKNFYEHQGKPLWRHSYDILKQTCDQVAVPSDSNDLGVDIIHRPENASNTNASILDVIRYAYMSLDYPYDFIVCLFANTVGFTAEDISDAIEVLISNELQEVRGFNFDGVENGLLVMTAERLFNPPGISSYLGCVVSAGQEIHYKEELENI